MLLYYITDRKQFPGGESEQRRQMIDCVAAAAAAGVDWIQLREKDFSARALESLAQEARNCVQGTQAKLLLNHRLDVALATVMDGIHLTSDPGELVPSDARAIFAKGGQVHPLIGISCHTEAELLLADAHGADFAVFGPTFGKGAIPGQGLAAISAVQGKLGMKVLALGGVTLANAAACLAAGADGIAGIRLFQENAKDMAQLVSSLRNVRSTQAGR